MHIQKIEIKNFRLLVDVNLSLEKQTTVIVGRNNSGKTSLTELFRRLLSDNAPKFKLEDFSLAVHEQFWNAFKLKSSDAEDNAVRDVLPVIEARLTLGYEEDTGSFGPLSDFIIDLNPDCTKTLIIIRYELEDGKINAIFEDIEFNEEEKENKIEFFQAIKERVPKLYKVNIQAVDPNDPTNQKNVEFSRLRSLLHSGFITAQRGLDDITHKDKGVLCNILENLFKTAMSEAANPADRGIAKELEAAVQGIQANFDKDFNNHLTNLLPAFSMFGYPGLSDPGLRTETTFNVQSLLENHTKVRYEGANGINLPEAYNGLGPRNLIFILLQLLEFFKSFNAKQAAPGVHLVFIEEPEAHLHPQMQEVFIRQLEGVSKLFSDKYNDGLPWPVQFIVTTHSSHVANEVSFNAIRYFLAVPHNLARNSFQSKIKDLNEGFSNTSSDDRDFLHQYLTLTSCDLFFADKAVLIEGTTERLLLPRMIQKVDNEQTDKQKLLSNQYISIMEAGGHHAHIFFELLDFLELHTLIITDLDAVDRNNSGKACMVSEGTHTSNSCIKSWFKDSGISPSDLIRKSDNEKIRGIRRLSYQVPEKEEDPCGRSFEDAFMLANPDIFELTDSPKQGKENQAWEKAQKVKKIEFALRYAIEETSWTVPRYVAEGLNWLAEDKPSRITMVSPSFSENPETEIENPQSELSVVHV
jgi:putative ATP-dependent endonuclease of the OLD family